MRPTRVSVHNSHRRSAVAYQKLRKASVVSRIGRQSTGLEVNKRSAHKEGASVRSRACSSELCFGRQNVISFCHCAHISPSASVA